MPQQQDDPADAPLAGVGVGTCIQGQRRITVGQASLACVRSLA
jgi:hypothetical protein